MKTLSRDRRSVALFLMIFSITLLFFSSSWGLNFPEKPINLIVSSDPGGPADLHARILAQVASKDLGVPVIVINKGGPGGALAASFVASEKADGYTLLVTQSGTMSSNFLLFPDLSYKKTDFVPIFRSVIFPCYIAGKSDSPWKTVKEFINAAKVNRGKFRSGSSGANLTLLWEALLKQEGLDVTHLPYKSAALSLNALMGGHIDISMDPVIPMIPHIDAGKIRLLATINANRVKLYPDVPTLYELGYHMYSQEFCNGFFGPVGVPQLVIEKLVDAFKKALSQPDVQTQLNKIGISPGFLGPTEFSKLIDEEYKFYMELGKKK